MVRTLGGTIVVGPKEYGIEFLFSEKLPGRRAEVQDILDACERIRNNFQPERKEDESDNKATMEV